MLAAGTPDQALEIVAANPAIDVILSDIVLPGKSGPALVEEIRRQVPQARSLFMSGFSDEALQEQGRIESDVSILEKPFEEHELARRIEELMPK